ncbi:MAG: shikimate dehydrogenase [Desulfovibrionaceae bacterium]|nr:shikimate dehydrogenase [Desulfovibrionaceae bacterium]
MFLPQKLYGVIGDPIDHSLSPLLHTTAFQAAGIAAVLLPWRIAAEHLAGFVAAFRLLSMAGACVTLPHKEAMVPLVDRVSPLARAVGAVNTLYWDGGDLVGHNTDVEGFLQPLASRGGFSTALILGAGGAARAVLAGLLTMPGLRRVLVAARREGQARALTAGVRAPEGMPGEELPAVEIVPWDSRHDVTADLVINCTPVGLSSGKDASASPLTEFRGRGLAYDLIYRTTPFLDKARAAGWETLNGRDMFAAQAAAQFRLWTGLSLPDEALAALDDALHQPEALRQPAEKSRSPRCKE